MENLKKGSLTNNNSAGNQYRNYVLVMLTLVYVFNFIDRQLLVILQESIKKELHLSDTQLGMLSGFTFALFYVSLGIPIARLAVKGNRRNIVTASLALWSIMTALSGLSRNFVQLLLESSPAYDGIAQLLRSASSRFETAVRAAYFHTTITLFIDHCHFLF